MVLLIQNSCCFIVCDVLNVSSFSQLLNKRIFSSDRSNAKSPVSFSVQRKKIFHGYIYSSVLVGNQSFLSKVLMLKFPFSWTVTKPAPACPIWPNYIVWVILIWPDFYYLIWFHVYYSMSLIWPDFTFLQCFSTGDLLYNVMRTSVFMGSSHGYNCHYNRSVDRLGTAVEVALWVAQGWGHLSQTRNFL